MAGMQFLRLTTDNHKESLFPGLNSDPHNQPALAQFFHLFLFYMYRLHLQQFITHNSPPPMYRHIAYFIVGILIGIDGVCNMENDETLISSRLPETKFFERKQNNDANLIESGKYLCYKL